LGVKAFEYLRLEDKDAPTRQSSLKVADRHWSPARITLSISVPLLPDLPTIRQWIEGLLTDACLLQLEAQIIVGASSSIRVCSKSHGRRWRTQRQQGRSSGSRKVGTHSGTATGRDAAHSLRALLSLLKFLSMRPRA
jgi:hypothetical protein